MWTSFLCYASVYKENAGLLEDHSSCYVHHPSPHSGPAAPQSSAFDVKHLNCGMPADANGGVSVQEEQKEGKQHSCILSLEEQAPKRLFHRASKNEVLKWSAAVMQGPALRQPLSQTN
jgi:hypothetical protein